MKINYSINLGPFSRLPSPSIKLILTMNLFIRNNMIIYIFLQENKLNISKKFAEYKIRILKNKAASIETIFKTKKLI